MDATEFNIVMRSSQVELQKYILTKRVFDLKTATELARLAEVELLICNTADNQKQLSDLKTKIQFYTVALVPVHITPKENTMEIASSILSRAGEELTRADEAMSETIVTNYRIDTVLGQDLQLLNRITDDCGKLESDSVIIRGKLGIIVKRVANNKVLAFCAMILMTLAFVVSVFDLVNLLKVKAKK